MLFVDWCWLFVLCCGLAVVRGVLSVGCWLLFVLRRLMSLCNTRCVYFDVCCLFVVRFVVCCVVLLVVCSMMMVNRVLSVVRWWLTVARCLLCVAC